MYADQRTVMKNVQLVGVLERMCQGLELTDSQFELAKSRYEGVGRWLADAEDLLIRTVAIYLQGSTAIGTTVKPIGSNEHDVDLVAHVSEPDHIISPPALKAAIGNRLRANGHYARILEEMGRCWRLNYANEFHLDITPSIPNPTCGRGGELVPDKEMRDWSASNPKGYKALFLERAKLIPQMRLMKGRIAADSAGSHEPYPKQVGFKGILPRTVQLAKRHRDIHFQNLDPCLAPISVIITTLASRSYEFCVRNRIYDSELDLLCDVIRCMPFFIQIDDLSGRRRWFIWNETTDNENFAEKWNADPGRAQAFYSWHGQLLADLESLTHIEGLDMLAKQLGGAFGRDPATQAGRRAGVGPRRVGLVGVDARPRQHVLRERRLMVLGRRRALTASQQFLNLQANPLSAGCGELHAGSLVWWCEVTPYPLSRYYRLRIEFRQGDTPDVFVESPDLKLLAGGRRLPHVYRQDPPRLCLYRPRTYEWQSWMRIDQTIVPWAILWLFYYEEWLVSDDWKGGGEHPHAPEVETRSWKRRPYRGGSRAPRHDEAARA